MKIKHYDNWRVEIEIPTHRVFLRDEKSAREAERDADDIVEQVKRHVDHEGGVTVQYDAKDVCSFCGYDWEVVEEGEEDEDYPVGMPACCTEAQEEFLKKRAES